MQVKVVESVPKMCDQLWRMIPHGTHAWEHGSTFLFVQDLKYVGSILFMCIRLSYIHLYGGENYVTVRLHL